MVTHEKKRLWRIIQIFIIILLILSISGCAKTYTSEELNSHFKVYLDDNYTQEWTDINQPDLTKLNWARTFESIYIKDSANLTVYLENDNQVPVYVFADWSEQETRMGDEYFPADVIPNGWWVSSEKITLNPKQKAPMTISISMSDVAPVYKSEVSSNGLVSNNIMIYFHVYQSEDRDK